MLDNNKFTCYNQFMKSTMTVEEYLNGATVIETKNPWMEYMLSEEYADEIAALIELDCYDGPTGDA